MKVSTASATLAVAATGAAAQSTTSSWAAWSSSTPVAGTSTSCPAAVTTVKTITTTAYESTSEVWKTTVSVPIPTAPVAVPSVAPEWVTWDTASSTGAPVTTVPAGCTPASTVTSTTTVTSTISGTTTVTHDTLYFGVPITGDADASWAAWQPAATTTSVASGTWDPWSGGSSGSPAATSSASASWDPWSGSGSSSASSSASSSGSDSGSWNGWSGSSGSSSSSGSNNDQGSWGPGSWGGSGNGGETLGSGNEVFNWDPPTPSDIKSVEAPQYTQKPDGSWGAPANQGWADWNGGSGNGGDDNGNGGSGGSGGSGSNGTLPITNGTSTTNGTQWCGLASSNCTLPQTALAEVGCNDASDRSQWCGNFDIDTDYYTNYYDEFNSSYSSLNPGNYNGKGGFPSGGALKTFDFVITNGTSNGDGTGEVTTFLINGQSPGPAIEVNWGDLVQITVHNQLSDNGTAIHWHGIRQVGTNDQDGVPGITECATAPGQSRTYTWRASQYGTSWYHSHWGLQYGDGIIGPIIIHGPATANYDVDAGPVMITDTFGMSAAAFGHIISHSGPGPTVNYLLNGANTAADLSSGQHTTWKVSAGKKYLFRIINAAAQNMYSVSFDQHKMQVIAADFVPIVPYTTEWLNIGIGQRYDVIVEMDQAVGSYFLRAVTQTLCPSACINSGLTQANGIIYYDGVAETPLILPTSTINGNLTAADFTICNDEPLASLVPHLSMDVGTLSSFSASASTIPGGSVTLVNTTDDGSVFRWFLNNGALYVNYTQPTIQSISSGLALNNSVYGNPITLQTANEWVYFVIQNQFFAFHPMHLHGHDFAVLGQGDGLFDASTMSSTLNFNNPARRDTVMLKGAASPAATSGGYTVIGFQTDNPGAWLMHCHIAWHVDGGLALQWIERPDDMTASGFTSQDEFADQCSAYATYEAQGSVFQHPSGASGLRRREPTYFDKLMSEAGHQYNGVVRRDGQAKHYLDSHMKRGLGDGSNRRTFGRRR